MAAVIDDGETDGPVVFDGFCFGSACDQFYISNFQICFGFRGYLALLVKNSKHNRALTLLSSTLWPWPAKLESPVQPHGLSPYLYCHKLVPYRSVFLKGDLHD